MSLLSGKKKQVFEKKNNAQTADLEIRLIGYLPAELLKNLNNRPSFKYKTYLLERDPLSSGPVSEFNYIKFICDEIVCSNMMSLFNHVNEKMVLDLAKYYFRTHGREQVLEHLRTDPESNHRSIQLVGEVNTESIKRFENDIRTARSNNPFSMPVTLKLISPGGSAEFGRGLVAEIIRTTCPIWTIAEGMAASMAAMIWLAGDERYVGEFAEIVLHRAHTAPGFAAPRGERDLEQRLQSMTKINEWIFKIIEETTPVAFYEHCKTEIGGGKKRANEDLTLKPQDAIGWGLINKKYGILGMSEQDVNKSPQSQNADKKEHIVFPEGFPPILRF